MRESEYCSRWTRNQYGIWRTIVVVALVLFGRYTSSQAEEVQVAKEQPPKVLLRWKLKTDQVVRFKLFVDSRVKDNDPRQRFGIFDSLWKIEAREEDGSVTVVMTTNRIRLQYRSATDTVDYDSQKDEGFALMQSEGRDVDKELKWWRNSLNDKCFFQLTERGEVRFSEKYNEIPSIFVLLPELPDQPVEVGQTWVWKSPFSKDEDEQEIQLVKLEDFEGETIAWIENKTTSMKYRFLVNSGRYLDLDLWDRFYLDPDPKKEFIESVTVRCHLLLEGDKRGFDQLETLQSIQHINIENMIVEAAKNMEKIKEYLVGEKSVLGKIAQGLFLEHVEEINISENREQWMPIDWLQFARYLERRGDIKKCKQLLKEGARATANNSALNPFSRNVFLLQFADSLAELGDYEEAIKTCTEIGQDALAGLNATAKGLITVPESAMRNYAFLSVARKQAQAGLVKEATSTAESIDGVPVRSAAHWVVAMHLAEQNKAEGAVENVALAGKHYSPNWRIIEFETDGPLEVAVSKYRTLALGKLVICQAMDGRMDAMRETMSLIKNTTERNAILVELIVALDERGMNNSADQLISEIPMASRETVMAYKINHRIRFGNLAGIEQIIESIDDPMWRATQRMKFCKALMMEEGRDRVLQTHLQLASAEIDKVAMASKRALLLKDYAMILIESAKQAEAERSLKTASELVRANTTDKKEMLQLQLDIAAVMPGLDESKDFESRMREIEDDIDHVERHDKSSLHLRMVEVLLMRNEFEKAEAIARKIEDESTRCQAWVAIGKRYAYLLEIPKSRDSFEEAFEVAMQVNDVLGLDTVYSKGGAARFVAQQQGGCDLAGLLDYLDKSSDPNTRAYGYVGGVESLDAKASASAARTGRVPEGVLHEVCESSLACKILLRRSQLDKEMYRAREQKNNP